MSTNGYEKVLAEIYNQAIELKDIIEKVRDNDDIVDLEKDILLALDNIIGLVEATAVEINEFHLHPILPLDFATSKR